MDSTEIIVTICGSMLMGLTLWFFFGKRPATRSKSEGALYACPMHLWITSSDPTAVCSLCGMKLVRKDGTDTRQ